MPNKFFVGCIGTDGKLMVGAKGDETLEQARVKAAASVSNYRFPRVIVQVIEEAHLKEVPVTFEEIK